jgi:hypothetical protein
MWSFKNWVVILEIFKKTCISFTELQTWMIQGLFIKNRKISQDTLLLWHNSCQHSRLVSHKMKKTKKSITSTTRKNSRKKMLTIHLPAITFIILSLIEVVQWEEKRWKSPDNHWTSSFRVFLKAVNSKSQALEVDSKKWRNTMKWMIIRIILIIMITIMRMFNGPKIW